MDFTYEGYRNLIRQLHGHGYSVCNYTDWGGNDRCVILRHDIDNDIEKAVKLAEVEYGEGVKSTYFVLLTSDFYNVFSLKNNRMLRRIAGYGHSIGLHFDEVRYPEIQTCSGMREKILQEADILSQAIGQAVASVSMHRPSKKVLEADLKIPGIINSYGETFFKQFKYISDSRRRWREPVLDIIASEKYKRLHILTHAFWYCEKTTDIHDTIKAYVNHANLERFLCISENITDIDEIINRDEVLYE